MKLNLTPEEVDILLLGLIDLRFRCECNAAMTNMSPEGVREATDLKHAAARLSKKIEKKRKKS